MEGDGLEFKKLLEIPGVPYDCRILESDSDSTCTTFVISKLSDVWIEHNLPQLLLPASFLNPSENISIQAIRTASTHPAAPTKNITSRI